MESSRFTLEDIGFGGLKIYQSTEGFRFGVDAVILADFADSLYPGAETVIDLGTGNGIIPVILSHKNSRCRITGIDVQPGAIELARMSCIENSLENRIRFIESDILEIFEHEWACRAEADCVVSNPPYVARGAGLPGANSEKMIARQETTADFDDFARTAAMLLRERGHFFTVHRPSRLVDIFCSCRKYRLEPKDIRFVYPSEGKTANIVLVHCILGGRPELNHMKPLYVYGEDGEYHEEIMKIYEK